MAKGIITCFSAGNSEYKDITIPTAIEVCPDNLVIRFYHANTYGETTADTPTHPKIRVYNADDTLLKTLHICDSTGHYAGKGCYGDDFIMEFTVIDDNDESLAIIKNSDVREKTASYVIKSDGSCEQCGYLPSTNQSGNTITLPVPYKDTNYFVYATGSHNGSASNEAIISHIISASQIVVASWSSGSASSWTTKGYI